MALILSSGCDGEIAEPNVTIDIPDLAPFRPDEGRLRRLTQDQYITAVQDVFGEEISVSSALEPDERASGLLAIGAGEASVSARGVEQYEDAAYVVAEQVAGSDIGCSGSECARDYLRFNGRRLWRRPLTTRELDELGDIARQAEVIEGDFRGGLRYAIAALLLSPHFLFRSETGAPGDDGAHRLTSWEHASRLSYFLWNAGPDDELLDAAARGDLDNPVFLERQVERMLAAPRARVGVRSLFDDVLQLEGLSSLRKDPLSFPHMSPEVGPSAREETLRLVEWLTFEESGDYRQLFTTRTTFLNRKLASIYGVQAPAREGFARYEHEASSQRSGILGHISLLALNSHVGSSSATLRGIFVRRVLLCGEIPPPPANVDTSIPEPIVGAATLRDRVRRHLEDASCAQCHERMDPLGLGLENFDAIGRFRTHDNGALIDASGDVDGATFETPREFGVALAQDPEVMRCAAVNFYRYAHGHRNTGHEEAAIAEIGARFADSGYRILELMRAVALHDSFSRVAEARP
ncbi:MAG: hypothetical protein ACI9KE_001056 [Polyangiales bacterium]|jgi:hypothetical protein